MTNSEFEDQLLCIENMLNQLARKFTTNKEDAKDLVQETYLKIIMGREQFKDHTNLKAWAYTIMKNAFINHYRKNSKLDTMVDHTHELFFLNSGKNTYNIEPDSILCENEINTAIEQLESKFRIPFKMYMQGYKYKEIAKVLKLNIETIKKRIYYSRDQLIKLLSEYKENHSKSI